MASNKLQIVLIDDNLPENDPLIVELRLNFPKATVTLKKTASEGTSYIMEHINEKMIVFLDYNLGHNQPNGTEVFLKIRKETSLIYFIMMTANQLNTIHNEDLITYINNDALAIINNTDDVERTIALVKKAVHSLDTRLDCVLEQWIARHSDAEQEQPYLTTAKGKTYTLKDLLIEIRMQTPLGQEIERNMLMLTIDLLTRGKESIND